MNVFHYFMQGAAHAAITQGEPLIDEPLSLVIDSAFIYMVKNPDADSAIAFVDGARRVNDPTSFANE